MTSDDENNADTDTDEEEGEEIRISESDNQEEEDSNVSSASSGIGLVEAQNRAKNAASNLLDHEPEKVIKAESEENGWRTVIEVVERSAIPDTQDIIGRYEITLDSTGEVTGYEILERYRRGDMKEEL